MGIHRAQAIVRRAKSELEKRVSAFDSMWQEIFEHIKLDVLEDEDFGKVFYPRGKLILPTTMESQGYYVCKQPPVRDWWLLAGEAA